MKRSELEQQLAEHIKGKVLAPPGFSYIGLASQLLTICENSGMTPPARWRDKNYGEGHEMTYSQWIQLPSKVNEWEPENETK